VPPTEKLRLWTDWDSTERAVYAAIVVVEIAVVIDILIHGGRKWTPLVVIVGLGVLWLYDLVVQRRHRTPDA
jgi:hypothetical protein